MPPSASLRYTCEFVRASLPQGARDVIEIGCGAGELAALLAADGLNLVAIDTDAELVAEARAAVLDARVMRWPAPIERRFDAVLITRSLHHIDDLPGAVDAARGALKPDGRIIVEDFCAEGGSERSSRWFGGLARVLHAGGGLSPDIALDELLAAAAPSSTHDHHLHSSTDIARELGRLSVLAEADAAYYFRYFEPHLREPGAARELLAFELDMIAQGTIDALGKRFVVEDR